jgi:hypothetical protein
MRETELLAVGGPQKDSTVLEIESIQQPAHRGLNRLVQVLFMDGDEFDHELFELNRFFERRLPLIGGRGFERFAGRAPRLPKVTFSHCAWYLHAAYRSSKSSPLRYAQDLRSFPPECRSQPAMSEVAAVGGRDERPLPPGVCRLRSLAG